MSAAGKSRAKVTADSRDRRGLAILSHRSPSAPRNSLDSATAEFLPCRVEEILKLATPRLPQLLAVLPINAPVSRLYIKVFMDWLTDMLGGFSYGFISSIAVTIFGSLATIASHLLTRTPRPNSQKPRAPANAPRATRGGFENSHPAHSELLLRRTDSAYTPLRRPPDPSCRSPSTRAAPQFRRLLLRDLAGVANSCFFGATRLTKRAQPSAPRPSSFSPSLSSLPPSPPPLPPLFRPTLTAGSDPARRRAQVLGSGHPRARPALARKPLSGARALLRNRVYFF